MSDKKHVFKIAIGDWSSDGHGMCEYIYVKSNKPVEVVRELYFNNVEQTGLDFGKVCCADYGDAFIKESEVEKLKSFGIDIVSMFVKADIEEVENELAEDGKIFIGLEMYVDILFQFLKLNNDLELEIVSDAIPMLQFYGRDSKNRHISGFGYGLFNC